VRLEQRQPILEQISSGARAPDRWRFELLQDDCRNYRGPGGDARLEDEVAALRSGGLSGDSVNGQGQAGRRLGHLAASIVQADRQGMQ